MTKLSPVLGVTTSLLLLAVLPLRAGIVANASFENGAPCHATVASPCPGQSPWVFTPASSGSALNVIGGLGSAPGGGSNFVRFGGVIDGSYDTVSQVLTTTSGQLYDLTFWLYTADGNADADFRALWDGVVVYDNPAGTDSAHQFPWTQITVSSLSGTGSDLLAFQAYNPPADTRLDLVDVQPVSAPEPASWVLMSIGALAIAYRRLR